MKRDFWISLMNRLEASWKSRSHSKGFRLAFYSFAVVSVFLATYMMILPAITIDRTAAGQDPGMNIAEPSQRNHDSTGTSGEDRNSTDDRVSDETTGKNTDATTGENSGVDASSADTNVPSQENSQTTSESDSRETRNSDLDSKTNSDQENNYENSQGGDNNSQENHRDNNSSDQVNEAEKPGSDSYALITEPTTLTWDGNDYTVTAFIDEFAMLPQGTSLEVREIRKNVKKEKKDYQGYFNQALEEINRIDGNYIDGTGRIADSEGVGGTGPKESLAFARFFDIRFIKDGQEIEPVGPVVITITLDQSKKRNAIEGADAADLKKKENIRVVHFDENVDDAVDAFDEASRGTVVEEVINDSIRNKKKENIDIQFTGESFSVYGVVYTVDFHWEADGKTYEYSMPGGGYISLTELIKKLKVPMADTDSDNNTVKQFTANIDQVEFSDSDLVWTGKAEKTTTVGELKKENNLDVQYSNDLTQDQIKDINAQTVKAGDWALISVQPFDSEEILTVTMANGDAWTVKVTDAQITTLYLSDSGKLFEVTVTYDEKAGIPDGSSLRVTEFSKDDEEYKYARKALLADKKSRGEWVDLSSLGLAAMDISILNPDGKEIEPEASVQVEIRIKKLPGVEDLSDVEDTLAIQHHVEVKDGVVVETVFDGKADASFKLNTNDTVAAKGKAVDPNSVKEEDFTQPQTTKPNSGQGAEDDDINVTFRTPVFSTFTVTWGAAGTPSQSRVSGLSNGKYILYARDAANNNYYALVPGTELNSVRVTLNNSNIVQYSGSENLYWDVEVSGGTYYFSFTENGTKYYLAAGTTGQQVQVGTSKTDYGDANTTSWGQWADYIHSAQDTFLQSYNGTFRTWNVSGQNNWGNRSQVYFERVNSAPQATIHYVDEAGNELDVSNGSISSSTLLNNYGYLIYDIEGGEYEYKETYIKRNSTDTTIRAYLYWNGSNWWYNTGGSNWSSVNDNDDIYVVYKKKTTPSDGGTPTLVELDDDEKPEAPTVMKDSTVNGDGTNTLSLSVTSHTKPREVLKLADVIVIFDRSGSMKENINNSDEASTTAARRMTLLQNAVNGLADDLIGDDSEYIYTDPNGVKHKQIEMSLVSFSTVATDATAFTDDADAFKAGVNALTPDGGTNWEQALQKANEASVDEGRATFVIFVTDGEPTFRMSRMTDTDSSLSNDMYFPNSYTDYGTYYLSNNVYGTGNSDERKDNTEYGRNYRAALAQAQAIVGKNKNLYMIGVGPEVANLEQFNTDAGAAGYYPATTTDQLSSAFADIKKRIAAMAGYSDFQISDGITELTQTVQKSTLVNFSEDDFTYYKGKVDHEATQADVDADRAKKIGDPVVLTWNTWDPDSENCEKVKYENGAVVWNMGSSFMPEEGYTYQVRFKVWPSQEAYDLLADLNNGKKKYADLSDEEKAQISEPATTGGMYTLKTNSDTSYNYKDATIVDGTVTADGDDLLSPPGTFPDVDPLELTTKPLKVKKQWHNNYVDSRTLTDNITLELYGVDSDGTTSHDFKTITLSKDDGWYAENNYISYGLVTYDTTTNAGAKVYETGHDFTLRETDDEAHYYELTAGIYRPMFINGTPTILEKVDAAPAGMSDSVFHYSDGSHHYYRLDGKIYRDTQSDILLIATNSHRSYMDLNKVVVDESGATVVDDTEFEYKITFTVPEGIDNYDTMEKYIWFSVYDTVARRTLAPSEYTCTGVITPAQENAALYSGSQYANYLVATSGQEMTIKIKQGWNVRFLNLPNGTTYSFEEINIKDGYNFVNAEVSGTRWIANMEGGTDKGKAETMSGLPSNTSASNDNTGISGTIEYANARYGTTYTNKTLTQQVHIQKTTQDTQTPLQGAEFSLYTESGYNADPKRPLKTGLTSDQDGKIDLGRFAVGKYYLVETKAPAGYILLSQPVTINVTGSGVTYSQSDNSLSQDKKGVIHQNETDPYTLVVTNNPGVKLPSTGGPGSNPLYLTGLMLTGLAGLGLMMKKRAKKAI